MNCLFSYIFLSLFLILRLLHRVAWLYQKNVELTEQTHQQQFLSVRIKNSSDGKYHFGSAGQLLSTKSGIGHGIELKRIKQIVTQAGGFFHIDAASDCFEVTIALNLRRDLPENESS